ncbi:MAG TPA: preprotein translocase subunit SecG [Bryobacteraceae bacterium]|nr:preprotein translocase subunit SecG [Bryobacteraceae bacterium]
MVILLTIVHVLVCLFLIVVVLLQSGKAADLAGAFGGMGSQTAFGPRGSATLLSKATTISAVLFMFTSLTLSILATRYSGPTPGGSVLEQQGKTQTAPAAPSQAPAPKPAAGQPAQPAQGQPSVTLTPEGGGPGRTIPLDVPAKSGQAPAPAKPSPEKK